MLLINVPTRQKKEKIKQRGRKRKTNTDSAGSYRRLQVIDEVRRRSGGGMFPPVVGKETKWVYEALKSRRWMKPLRVCFSENVHPEVCLKILSFRMKSGVGWDDLSKASEAFNKATLLFVPLVNAFRYKDGESFTRRTLPIMLLTAFFIH